jgi:putative transcriptional regulator
MQRLIVLFIATVAVLAGPVARAGTSSSDEEEAVFLIATPRLIDPRYARSVLLVVPIDNDQHIGFIINRPTHQSLASLFPEHEPSKKVMDPVFVGGPMAADALFALVRTDRNPGGDSLRLMDHLYFAKRVDIVDHVIETTPNDARYYVGYVEWRPGELREELSRGLWLVSNADLDTVFRKDTAELWEELTHRSEAINASIQRSIRLAPGRFQQNGGRFRQVSAVLQ